MSTDLPDQAAALGRFAEAILANVRSDAPDLSQRQLAVMLVVYMSRDPQTVRGLAAHLNVSRGAITRALDRLGQLDFAQRRMDPRDLRSVLVQQTEKGAAYVRRVAAALEAGASCGATGPVQGSPGIPAHQ